MTTLKEQLRDAEQERDRWKDVYAWLMSRVQEAENKVTLCEVIFALEVIVALGRGAEQLDPLGTKMVQIAHNALAKAREDKARTAGV